MNSREMIGAAVLGMAFRLYPFVDEHQEMKVHKHVCYNTTLPRNIQYKVLG